MLISSEKVANALVPVGDPTLEPLASDRGKVYRIDLACVVLLPASNIIGLEFTFVKNTLGNVVIRMPDGHSINGSGAAGTVSNTTPEEHVVISMYTYRAWRWAITHRDGTWEISDSGGKG